MVDLGGYGFAFTQQICFTNQLLKTKQTLNYGRTSTSNYCGFQLMVGAGIFDNLKCFVFKNTAQ